MAKKVKPQVSKKEQAEKLLYKVPEEYVFWCHDGTVFRDLKDLANGLIAMSDETYAYHVTPEINDFSNWVRDVIKDEKLANDLALTSNKVQAAEYVKARMTYFG